jgi:hypothetical protein
MNAASPQAVMGELMGLEDQLSPQDRYTLAQGGEAFGQDLSAAVDRQFVAF